MSGEIRARVGPFDALILTSLLWFLGKFVRYVFPPLFDRLAGVYAVSTALLGTAFTGLLLVYALMQFPSGLLADRFGSVTVLGAGGLIAAGAAFVLAVDVPFVVLVGAMLLLGAGTGTLKTVGVQLLSRAYPSRTGRALGVFDTFGTFGGVAAPAAVVVFAGLPGVFGAGWRTTFLLAGVVGLGVVALFTNRVPARLPDDTGLVRGGSGAISLGAYGALFREWRFSLFVVVTVLFSFAYNGVVAFLPLYLTVETGLPSTTANLLYSVLFVASLIQLVTGEISDRMGTLPVLGATLGLATAGLSAVVLLPGDSSVLALGGAVLALGLGAHGYRPVRGAYLVAVTPESVTGGSVGAVRTLLMLAGALAPALVGVLSETAGFRPAFWLLAAALAGATALTAGLWLVDL